jgi:hypothetical protein
MHDYWSKRAAPTRDGDSTGKPRQRRADAEALARAQRRRQYRRWLKTQATAELLILGRAGPGSSRNSS